jgi:hypothetical protein
MMMLITLHQSKRMFGKYSFALTNPRESPLPPLKKGGTRIKVPLKKGDLGGFVA